MKWILVWIASMVTLFVSAYHYNFFNSIDELFKTYKLADFIVALCIGSISSISSIFIVFILTKLLLRFDVKIHNYIITTLEIIISILFCIIITKKIYMILSAR